MVAPAVAVAEGLTPHTDVFTLYGPVIVHLQAFAVSVGSGGVLAVRSLYVLMVAAVAGLMVLSGSTRQETSWPIPVRSSLLATAAWIPLSTTLTGIPIFPWVSLVVTGALVGAVVLLRLGFESPSAGRRRGFIVAAATLAATATLSRPPVGLILIAFGVAFLLRPGTDALVRLFAKSVLAAHLALAAAVAVIGWGQDFVTQMLLWPVQEFLRGGYTGGSVTTLLRGAVQLAPQVGMVLLLLRASHAGVRRDVLIPALGVLVLLTALTIPSTLRSAVYVLLLAVLMVVLLTAHRWSPVRPSLRTASLSLLAFVLIVAPALWFAPPPGVVFIAVDPTRAARLFIRISTNALYVLLLTGLALAVAQLARTVVRPQQSTPLVIIASLAIAATGELASFADPLHVWWALPVIALMAASAVHWSPTPAGRRSEARALALATAAVLVGASFSVASFLSKERVRLDEGIAAGMRVYPEAARQYRGQLAAIRQLGSAEIAFFVAHPLVTVIDGEFRSATPAIVSWSPGSDFAELVDFDAIIVQDQGVGLSVSSSVDTTGFSVSTYPDLPGYRILRRVSE